MGGPGSGSWYRSGKKDKVEDLREIDVRRWHREGFFRAPTLRPLEVVQGREADSRHRRPHIPRRGGVILLVLAGRGQRRQAERGLRGPHNLDSVQLRGRASLVCLSGGRQRLRLQPEGGEAIPERRVFLVLALPRSDLRNPAARTQGQRSSQVPEDTPASGRQCKHDRAVSAAPEGDAPKNLHAALARA
jgi:hypothetical protein